MTTPITLCVIAGMIDAKLQSKLLPIQKISSVEKIYLVRRQPYIGEKIIGYFPPDLIKKFIPLAELWRIANIFWILLRHRPAYIIALGTVPHGLYAWILGKLFRIPVIQHVMGKNDLRLTYPQQRFRKLCLSAVCAGRFVAVRGQYGARYLIQNGVDAARLFYPQNLHDFNLFKPDPKSQKDFDFIYVGLLAAYKRLDLLIDTMALVCNKYPKSRLLIVGNGVLGEHLVANVKARGLSANILFHGKCEFTQLPTLYNRARCFVMSSQGEGLPMAMIEAMSCGLPAIVAHDADISDIAIHHENALLVAKFTPDAFAQAILTLLDNPLLWQQLCAGALRLRTAKNTEYSVEYQTALWARILEKE